METFSPLTNHREALLKALAGMEASVHTTLEELVGFFISKRSYITITFDDVDLHLKGIKHKRVMYLNRASKNKFIRANFVENGSLLNIYRLRIVRKLGAIEAE